MGERSHRCKTEIALGVRSLDHIAELKLGHGFFALVLKGHECGTVETVPIGDGNTFLAVVAPGVRSFARGELVCVNPDVKLVK